MLGVLSAALTASVILAGCSTKGDTTVHSKKDATGVKTDYGVTDAAITIGSFTDASGPAKPIGLIVSHGVDLWAADTNAAGGICGRQIKIDTRDTGYSADKALTLYQDAQPKILSMVQLLGSPALAALKQQLTNDKILTIPTGIASSNLDTPVVYPITPTYDIEMINGMAFLQDQGFIADGDSIGHIYSNNELGMNALEGAKYYASKHNQKIVEVPIAPTETDMTAAVTKLKSSGVKAILVSSPSVATISVLGQVKSQGLDVPVLGSGPAYDSSIASGPAKNDLGNFYYLNSVVPFDADVPLAKKIAAAYQAKYSDPPSSPVLQGYVAGLAMQSILERACADKDLTRAGVVAASTKVTIKTHGLTETPEKYTIGVPPARSSLIDQVDPSLPGTLKIFKNLFISPEAKEYSPATSK